MAGLQRAAQVGRLLWPIPQHEGGAKSVGRASNGGHEARGSWCLYLSSYYCGILSPVDSRELAACQRWSTSWTEGRGEGAAPIRPHPTRPGRAVRATFIFITGGQGKYEPSNACRIGGWLFQKGGCSPALTGWAGPAAHPTGWVAKLAQENLARTDI